jgi:hypothetical protein
MIRRILFALAISTIPPTLAYAIGDTTIQTVEIAPLFYQRFACTEHVNGELSDLGDALGSDCLVLGGMGENRLPVTSSSSERMEWSCSMRISMT